MHRSRRHGAQDQAGHDPFAEMHRSMMQLQQSMMPGFNDPFFGDPFMARQDPFAQASRRVPIASEPRGRSQMQIQEVDDEAEEGRTHTDAIVEEPDDEGYSHDRRASPNDAYQRHASRHARAEEHPRQFSQRPAGTSTRHQTAGHNTAMNSYNMNSRNMAMSPFGGGAFSSMFDNMFGRMDSMFGNMLGMPSMGNMLSQMPQGSGTYYSSSSMYCSSGGPGGITYEKTSSKRMGPGGVMEEQHTVRDGRTGEEKMTITRGVGERQRTLERARINGQERRNESLKGIHSADEAARFDEEWRQRAAGSLPPDIGSMRRGSRAPTPHTPYLDYQPRRA